jgi:branched-chain amino acid transport system permease protein
MRRPTFISETRPASAEPPAAGGRGRAHRVLVPGVRTAGGSVGAGIIVLALLTLAFTTTWSYYAFTFDTILLAVLGAVALNLLMGTAGLVSIGNAAFLEAGAFATLIFLRMGVPFPLTVILAGAASAAIGIVIGLPAMRLSGIYLALATLAGFFIITYFANEYQTYAKGGGAGGFVIPALYASKGLTGSVNYWAWTLFVLVALLLVVCARMSRWRAGRAWRLARENETAARALGIRVPRYKMMAFALSSAIIGVEGGLTLYFSGSVSTDDFTLTLSVSYVAMVLIGGLDSIAGAVIGAAAVTALPVIVPKVLNGVLGSQNAASYSSAVSEIIYGVLIMVFIISSSQGLVGVLRRAATAAQGWRAAGRWPFGGRRARGGG